jgi:hypothetical protein
MAMAAWSKGGYEFKKIYAVLLIQIAIIDY